MVFCWAVREPPLRRDQPSQGGHLCPPAIAGVLLAAVNAVEDQRELQAVAGAAFFKQGGNVGLDGALGNVELPGDFLVARSLGDQAGNLQFALGEFFLPGGGCLAFGWGSSRAVPASRRCSRLCPTHRPPLATTVATCRSTSGAAWPLQ